MDSHVNDFGDFYKGFIGWLPNFKMTKSWLKIWGKWLLCIRTFTETQKSGGMEQELVGGGGQETSVLTKLYAEKKIIVLVNHIGYLFIQ